MFSSNGCRPLSPYAHSDSVDVKFVLRSDDTKTEKTIALGHLDLLEVSEKDGTTGDGPVVLPARCLASEKYYRNWGRIWKRV